MPDTILAAQLADERSAAIRALLASPLIDIAVDRDAFTLIARHGEDLISWFDTTLGWTLHVDHAVGYARLAKRSSDPDARRPLRRPRGARAPFDRRRYALVCLICAEMVGNPVSTIGVLAPTVGPRIDLDTTKHGDRRAFVDALRVLTDLGVVSVSSGQVDDFVADESANALLTAESSRLNRLLTTVTSPSRLDRDLDFQSALAAILAEPRYGDTPDDHRWTRHRLARRLLDDPVLHLDDCTDDERDYLGTGAGRQWLRDRIAEAGFELEERAEGLLAVDPTATATDIRFPAPLGTTHQVALLLIDDLTEPQSDGARVPATRPLSQLVATIRRRLDEHPGWARSHRDGDGPDQLVADAIDLLESLGLCRSHDQYVAARPALCRYRPLEPAETQMTLT